MEVKRGSCGRQSTCVGQSMFDWDACNSVRMGEVIHTWCHVVYGEEEWDTTGLSILGKAGYINIYRTVIAQIPYSWGSYYIFLNLCAGYKLSPTEQPAYTQLWQQIPFFFFFYNPEGYNIDVEMKQLFISLISCFPALLNSTLILSQSSLDPGADGNSADSFSWNWEEWCYQICATLSHLDSKSRLF